MTSARCITVGAAQLGPIAKHEPRTQVVERLRDLLREGAAAGCDLIVFPELALTTFFPRWFTPEINGHDHYFETAMPGPETQPLFDEAKELGVGFALGYADGHSKESLAWQPATIDAGPRPTERWVYKGSR